MGPAQGARSRVGVGSRGQGRGSTDIESEAWIEAFERQNTPAMLARCTAFAAQALGGVSVDALPVREMAHDVYVDTLMGRLAWDPEAKPLEQHLRDAIRWRARDEMKRARRHVSMNAVAEEEDADSWLLNEIDAHHAVYPHEESAEVRAERLLCELRGLVSADTEVLRLIDAYRDGARSQAEILACTSFSLITFRNARERLCWLARRTRRAAHEDARPLRAGKGRHDSQ